MFEVCNAHSISLESSDEDFTKMMYSLDETISSSLGTGANEEGTTALIGFLFPVKTFLQRVRRVECVWGRGAES